MVYGRPENLKSTWVCLLLTPHPRQLEMSHSSVSLDESQG